jgi:hypothetical protein
VILPEGALCAGLSNRSDYDCTLELSLAGIFLLPPVHFGVLGNAVTVNLLKVERSQMAEHRGFLDPLKAPSRNNFGSAYFASIDIVELAIFPSTASCTTVRSRYLLGGTSRLSPALIPLADRRA